MSSLTDLVVIGAVGVGAYYIYNNWKPAKAAADTTIETIGSTLDLAANPNLPAVKENLKEANEKVIEEINDSLGTDLPTMPEQALDLIVDLKGGSILPNAGTPAAVNLLTDATTPAVERKLDSGVDGVAKDYLNATNPVGQLTNLAGKAAGLIDDVINGRWEWTGLHL